MARPGPKPRRYEMMIVVAPTVTEDGLGAVVERVSGLIETYNGTVASFNHDSPWGRRRLAYPIQKFRDAFYVLYYFDMEPRSIDELDREIRLDSVIIRHLIVKYDPLTEREFGYGDSDQEEDGVDRDSAPDDADEQVAASASPEEDSDDDDEAEPEQDEELSDDDEVEEDDEDDAADEDDEDEDD